MKKRLLAGLLSVMTIAAMMVITFAADLNTEQELKHGLSNSIEKPVIAPDADSPNFVEEPVVAPDKEIDGTLIFDNLRTSHIVMDENVTVSGESAWYKSFNTTKEDPSYRVWIKNTGIYTFRVYVKRTSASSQDIMAGPIDLASGESTSIELTTDNYEDGNKPGRRWVVLDPINGNNISATVRVRIAPSLTELG